MQFRNKLSEMFHAIGRWLQAPDGPSKRAARALANDVDCDETRQMCDRTLVAFRVVRSMNGHVIYFNTPDRPRPKSISGNRVHEPNHGSYLVPDGGSVMDGITAVVAKASLDAM